MLDSPVPPPNLLTRLMSKVRFSWGENVLRGQMTRDDWNFVGVHLIVELAMLIMPWWPVTVASDMSWSLGLFGSEPTQMPADRFALGMFANCTCMKILPMKIAMINVSEDYLHKYQAVRWKVISLVVSGEQDVKPSKWMQRGTPQAREYSILLTYAHLVWSCTTSGLGNVFECFPHGKKISGSWKVSISDFLLTY